MTTAILTGGANLWVLIPILLFTILIIYFLVKFFSVLFDFIEARGCMTLGLVALVGLPGVLVLSLISGSNVIAVLLLIFALIGLITGYIARDSEGNVGKFGTFIMIVSAITLITAIILKYILSRF